MGGCMIVKRMSAWELALLSPSYSSISLCGSYLKRLVQRSNIDNGL